MRYLLRTVVVIVLLITGGMAQSMAPALVGEWEGHIQNGQQTLKLLLHVQQDKTGALRAAADSVTQNVFDIPVTAIKYEPPRVYFEASGGSYEAKMTSRNEMSGTWRQEDKSVPLAFTRISAAAARAIVGAAEHKLQVAFLVSDGFNMIDFAGPWEVFSDAMTYPNGVMKMLAETYTVSRVKKPIISNGAVLVPKYTLEEAPKPDVIVVPAQTDGSEEVLHWLRNMSADGVTIMSVCTGASKLAATGLLDGHQATSHHEALDDFAKRFPKIQWQHSRRYVQATDKLFTAGGLTSGIDLALHLVEQRFGRDVAQATADYMEYRGEGWKNPDTSNSASIGR
jgi:putative intracellular protease/amidase